MLFRLTRRILIAGLLALITAFGLAAVASAQEAELLEVTEAFQLTASAPEAGHVTLHWAIAPDYYLYRGRISVRTAAAGVTLGELQLPPGEKEHDEFLGDVEIYHGELTATLPYTAPAGFSGPLPLAVKFQGCHEVDPKICYPPHVQKLDVALPAPVAANPSLDPAAPMSGGLAAALQTLGSGPATPLVDSGPGTPLPPEEAFHFEAIAGGPGSIYARFTMPSGYYLYRERSHIELAAGDGVTLGQRDWPTGVQHTDENFGTTEVFFTEADIHIPVKRDGTAAVPVTLKAVFQGCQDGGICYPLMTREVTITLPQTTADELAASNAAFVPVAEAGGVSGAGKNTAGTATAQSAEQHLAGLLAGQGRWLALLLFFGFGLLLAFTPCVLPMVPILSGLIAGAGEDISTKRAFVLSLVYVLATAVVFTIVGVVAGVAGANLQAAFQTPWVLWLFAAIFVLLSLSMFGFYELQLPTALQSRLTAASNKQEAGSLTGVAIMGVLSAFIVGPCVAPPLAAAVLYIAEQQDPVFGGLALFVLAMGMGVPLIIFGTAAGKLLPRAGAWMNSVKAVFGVLFLALAIWMLSRILAPFWIMLMTGGLLVACAVYMGALGGLPAGSSGWRKLWKALGLILLIFGAAELIGVAGGSRDLLQPLRGMTATTAQAENQGLEFRIVKTVDDLQAALAAAQRAGKPVMLDFYADWCVSCKEMERFTYSQPEVQQAMAPFVLLKADVTANDEADQGMLKHFKLYGPPATIFYGTDGKERRALRLIGFEKAGDFVARVNKVTAS